MARTYVIDAHNALHRILPGVSGGLDALRRELLRTVQHSLPSQRDRAHLVFDAASGSAHAGTSSRSGALSWEYAVGSADDAIVGWLRGDERSTTEVTVVTDDRELRGRAKQLGAKTMRLREFFAASGEAAGTDRGAKAPPSPASGPALRAADFGLPDTPVDLLDLDPEDL